MIARCDLPTVPTGAQLLFRFIAAAYERRALGVASHWPFEAWGRFLPEHTTAVSLLDRLLHHANVDVDGGSVQVDDGVGQRWGRSRPAGDPHCGAGSRPGLSRDPAGMSAVRRGHGAGPGGSTRRCW